MAVAIYMENHITPEQYNEAMSRLNAMGAGAPKGRTYHAAFFEGDTLNVMDVWDSMEEFEAFGATLIPIMNAVGATLAEPVVSEIHNVVAA